MKRTSFGSSEVRIPAKSPGLSKIGPLVILKPTPSSLAMMLLSVVLPSPGGPYSSVWSSGSPRYLAASTKTLKFSTTFCWPLKSLKRSGRNAFSNSFSSLLICSSLISKSSFMQIDLPIVFCKVIKKRRDKHLIFRKTFPLSL